MAVLKSIGFQLTLSPRDLKILAVLWAMLSKSRCTGAIPSGFYRSTLFPTGNFDNKIE